MILIAQSYHFSHRTLRFCTRRNLFGNPEPKSNNQPAKKEGGGLFGGMGNMMEQMKKAQEIAKQAEVLQKELVDTIVIGSDSSGQVQASYNGLGVPISMKLSESVLSESADTISQMCTNAMIDGHTKAVSQMQQRMTSMYGGFGIGGPQK